MTTRTTLSALSHMCDAARILTNTALRRGMRQTARQTDHIAKQLDAARTVLVQEGPSYLPVAVAYLDVCADRLAAHAVWIGKCVDREPKRVSA